MPAQVFELAAYRAPRAPKATAPIAPTAARPANLRTSTDNAAAALATMAAACRAWAENLRRISAGAHQIAARSSGMHTDIERLKAESRTVTTVCATLTTLAVPSQLVAG